MNHSVLVTLSKVARNMFIFSLIDLKHCESSDHFSYVYGCISSVQPRLNMNRGMVTPLTYWYYIIILIVLWVKETLNGDIRVL